MTVHALQIAAPRSQRWYELDEICWARTETPLSELAETERARGGDARHHVGRRAGMNRSAYLERKAALLVWLDGREARTAEVAARIGVGMIAASHMLSKLLAAGEVSVRRGAGSGTPAMWTKARKL